MIISLITRLLTATTRFVLRLRFRLFSAPLLHHRWRRTRVPLRCQRFHLVLQSRPHRLPPLHRWPRVRVGEAGLVRVLRGCRQRSHHLCPVAAPARWPLRREARRASLRMTYSPLTRLGLPAGHGQVAAAVLVVVLTGTALTHHCSAVQSICQKRVAL